MSTIWLCPSAFFPHRGGVEELTLKLAHQLTGRGHHVTIVTNLWPTDLPATSAVEGLPCRRIRFTLPTRHPLSIVEHLRSRSLIRRQLVEIHPTPDLVHVICPSSQTAHVTGFAQSAGIRLVLTSQGETVMDAQRIYQRNPWLRRDLRRASVTANALTACSEWTRTRAAEVAPAFARASIVLNGVDPEDWALGPPPQVPVFLAWGRHVMQKGFDLLLAAFAIVHQRRPDSRLLLGGDGPETVNLRAHAGEGVEFLGGLDRTGVHAALARSRVVVVPSRIEPFGIVALEALAAGRGLVYSRHGGLSEAAAGCGTPADPFDAVDLARAMEEELRAPTPVERGRNRAGELAWPTITDQYEVIYRGHASSRGEPDPC